MESLITITEGLDNEEFQKSIKTPVFEDLEKCNDEFNIIAADGDLLSDGQQDNSCLLMLEKEWQEQQRAQNCAFDQSKTNIVFFSNDDDTTFEDYELARPGVGHQAEQEKFIKTQKIELAKSRASILRG